ncbi:MAG: hypothetical protein P857_653 [Candidatus Xenolissoclinum pacificiensis L6]|uniref:Uncharacterized protein n=1 Tax=Candidatus Xenolissoclinum pacificiensis L6 TaxID=1401685 RepID=W2UZ71_9RICK|nr:MAG: hypothetical protein P857_653 [Candidatus Xenolissoclinum pacificiensis L6]
MKCADRCLSQSENCLRSCSADGLLFFYNNNDIVFYSNIITYYHRQHGYHYVVPMNPLFFDTIDKEISACYNVCLVNLVSCHQKCGGITEEKHSCVKNCPV